MLIIGDYTARVGDPSGRSATRPALSGEEIDANARTFTEQALTVLDPDPAARGPLQQRMARHVDGATCSRWPASTTVGQLLERDDFAKRFRAAPPISVLELLYPLLQGYDSVAVRADVELGGTDQKFNLLLGRDIQRAYGQPEQVILTMPLLPGTDGERKMSKSLGNYIGVTDPPEEIYGKTLSIPDAALDNWYALLLGIEPARRSAPGRQAGAGPGAGRALLRRRRRRGGRGGVRPRARPRKLPTRCRGVVGGERDGAPAGAARPGLRRVDVGGATHSGRARSESTARRSRPRRA